MDIFKSKTLDFLGPKGYKFVGKLGADEVYEFNSKRYDLMLQWRIKLIQNYFSLLFKTIKSKLFNN